MTVSTDPNRPPASGQLPTRSGARPKATPRTPHVQLDQPGAASLVDRLWRAMTELPGVHPGRSGISAPSSRALHLDPGLAEGPREAFLVGTEFAHLHGDGSGSLHLALPAARVLEAIDAGWADFHPVVLMGLAPPTLVMLYGPRDDAEYDVVWGLVQESYRFARGSTTN